MILTPSSPANMAKFADADWWTCNMGGRFEDVISQFVAIDEVEWQMLVKSIPIRSTRIEIRGQVARPASLAPTPQPPQPALADLVSLLQAAIAQPLRSQPALAPPSQPVLALPAPPPVLALPAPQPPTEEPEDEPTQTANEAIQSGRVSLLDSAQALLDHATGINDGKGAKFFWSLWVSQVW